MSTAWIPDPALRRAQQVAKARTSRYRKPHPHHGPYFHGPGPGKRPPHYPPQLAEAIAPHLGAVTSGRYTDVTVDPEDLQVRVRAPSGAWREADRLSHGTAEQVYLLRRAALAQYLVTTQEPCPLILDDPTAYADDTRTTAVLQVLHRVSAERQVIVFSHDTHVLTWARDALNTPRDKTIELAGIQA